MTQAEIIQILAGFVGVVGFSVLFNIRGKRLVGAALGGLLSWLLFVLLGLCITDEPVRYFMVALAIALYAEVMARVMKTPTTTFIMTSLIPLIPGGSLYYAMASIFEADANVFMPKVLYTLQLASALAIGVIVSAALTKIVHRFKKIRGYINNSKDM